MRHHRQKRRARGAAAETSFELFEQELTGDPSSRRERGGEDRKTLQLCRQVERAIGMALAGECGDDLLRELYVDGVSPMGSASLLMVRLRVPTVVGLIDAMQRVDEHAVRLRHVVAQAISRKRVPTLTFVCLPAQPSEGGDHE